MSDGARDLLVRGLAAAREKEYSEARRYLEWMLRLEPDEQQRIEAWLALAEISSDPHEKRNYLEEVLSRDSSDMRARRMLAILDGRLKPEEIVDPDQLVQPVVRIEPATGARRFICPQCGGRMTYTPDGKSLVCEYCEAKRRLGTAPLQAEKQEATQDFMIAMATARGHLRPVTRRIFACQGCGISFVLPPQQLSFTCPHCDSVYVTEAGERETYQPHGLIPYGLEHRIARRLIQAWVERCVPRKELDAASGTALYIPVWTFDLSGSISWRGMRLAERKLTTAELILGGPQRRDWQTVRGDFPLLRSNVPVLASGRWPDECLMVLSSFDYSKVIPYDEGYLASWPAETYQVTVGDASLVARRQVMLEEQEHVRVGLGGQVRDLTFSSANMVVDTFRLLLLPVWLVGYNCDNRRYQAVINGQNGDVFGERP